MKKMSLLRLCKNGLFQLLLVAVVLCIASSVHAQIPITYYDFESNASRGTANEVTVEQTVNPAGNFSIVGATASTNPNGAATDIYGQSASGGSIGASAWQNTATDPGAAATTYFQVTVNTSNFTGITLNYDYRVSSTGPQGNGVIISDGTNTSVLAGIASTNSALFISRSWSLGTIANNKSTLTLKIYFYKGASTNFATAGTARIDNFTIKATTLTGGTVNLLDEDAYYTGCTSGSSGRFSEKNFTVTGSNTTCRLNNSGIQMDTLNTFLVTGGATLDCGQTATATMRGTGKFQLDAGCTMIIRSANGINATSTSGNIQTATRVYSSSANYIYQHFSGSNQSLGGGVPSPLDGSLTINNSGGVALSSKNIRITGTLNMLNGVLYLSTYNLTLSPASLLTGTFSATNMICTNSTGTFRKEFTAVNSFLYPVGDTVGTPEYSPITVAYSSGTFTSTAYTSVQVKNAKHPNNFSSTNYLNRYWTLAESGVSSYSCNLTMSYLDADIVGDENLMQVARYISTWSRTGTVNAASNTLTRSTTSFGDYTTISSVAPTITITGNTGPVCEGNTLNLTAVPVADAPYTLSWNQGVSAATTITSDPFVTTTYSVTVTDGNGLTGSASTTVTVNPSANVYAGQDQYICSNTNATLVGTIFGGATSATWTTSGDGSFSSATSLTSTYTPGPLDKTNGYAIVTLTSNDPDGPCGPSVDDLILNFLSLPSASASITAVSCPGAANGYIDLTVSGGSSPYSFSWTGGSTSEDIANATNQVYAVTVTDANGCQTNSSYTVGSVNPAPSVTATATPTSLCSGLSSTVVAYGAASYTWNASADLSSITGSSVVATPSATTSYVVTGTDANGCTASTSVSVTVIPSTSNTTNVTSCLSYTWSVNGNTYSASGNYSYVNGCHTEYLQLTILQQSPMPSLACYETASFNGSTCQWDVTGTQPIAPSGLACYETASFNSTTCQWEVTGQQPAVGSLACYETASFNTSTCSWDVTGTQPTAPSTACYETASFNSTTCQWEVTGQQPTAPSTACYETASFNTSTCSWDITGTQPTAPSTACYETASFNSTTCQWEVTGTPAAPIVTTTTSCQSYVWSANGLTYSSSGTYSYSSNCQDYVLNLTINSCNTGVTLNLVAFLEGYYLGSGEMTTAMMNSGVNAATSMQVDTIQVQLRDSLDPTVVIDEASAILNTDGTASLLFPLAVPGTSYWIVISHRSSVQTWSGAEVTLAATTYYDFSNADTQAYGSNLKEVEAGIWAIFTGDMNQDEFVDSFDFDRYNSDNLDFASGYFNTDLNGDGFVDNFDFDLFNSNNLNFIMSMHP